MELRSDLEEGEWSGGMVSIKGKAGAKDQWQDGVEGLTEAQIQGARDGSWRLANEKTCSHGEETSEGGAKVRHIRCIIEFLWMPWEEWGWGAGMQMWGDQQRGDC